MKIGDLVRFTDDVSPSSYRGKLALIVEDRRGQSGLYFPFMVKLLEDGRYTLVNAKAIELPEPDPDLT